MNLRPWLNLAFGFLLLAYSVFLILESELSSGDGLLGVGSLLLAAYFMVSSIMFLRRRGRSGDG
ncbi:MULTISPECIES: hypothetical protein [unclassified Aeromicrobium]|uniref:hypothetical protein n=1 Tax=unclassified Aeromicrobium TaxID=2633570 RepID=UPI00288B50F6|nr:MULTISPECIES: hypothetical protein [unclassified Aeromicrobium]